MNKYLFLIIVFLASLSRIYCQQGVQAMVVVPPPYAPYFNNYTSFMDGQLVTVQNYTSQTLEVKLTGFVNFNGGGRTMRIETDESYTPPTPLVMGPGQTRILTMNDQNLQYLSPNNTTISGDQDLVNAVIQTGILPEGQYSVCVVVKDYNTDEILSDLSLSCTFITIRYADPPILITPWCNQEYILNPDALVFQWSMSALFNANIMYDLYAAEVPDGMNEMDALFAAIDFGAGEFIFEKTDLRLNNYVRQPSDLAFEPGKKYAWAVMVRDLNNRYTFTNNGLSNICWFTIPQKEDTNPEFIPDVMPGDDDQDPFSATRTSIAGQLYYRWLPENLTSSPPAHSEAPIRARSSISNPPPGVQPTLERRENITASQMPAETRDFVFAGTVPFNLDAKALANKRIVLEQVLMSSYVPNPTKPSDYFVIRDVVGEHFLMSADREENQKFLNEVLAQEGEIDIVLAGGTNFNYYFPGLVVPLTSTTTDSEGKFVFNFQHTKILGRIQSGEFPFTIQEANETPVDGGGGLSGIKDLIEGKFGPGWRWNPTDIYRQGFDNRVNVLNQQSQQWNSSFGRSLGSGGSPAYNLLNNFSFINENHNQISQEMYNQNTVLRSQQNGGQMIYVQYPTGQKFSYRPEGNKLINSFKNLLSEIASYDLEDDYRSVVGYHIYRTLRIRVLNAEYCSPDIILIPEQGAQVQLDPEVVWVNAYDLEIYVEGAGGIRAGQALDGTNIMGGRRVSSYNTLKSTLPQGELNSALFGVEAKASDNTSYILMENTSTDSEGKTKWKNLVRHASMSGHSNRYFIDFSKYFTDNINYNSRTLLYGQKIAYFKQNHHYQRETDYLKLSLTAGSPEFYANFITRSGAVDGPLEGVSVKIHEVDNPSQAIYMLSDRNGFVQAKDLKAVEYRIQYYHKAGFVTQTSSIFPRNFTLDQGRREVRENVLMTPTGYVKGEIRDEHGNPVMAEIKIGDGPYFPTKQYINPFNSTWSAVFNTPARSGQNIRIIIHPMPDQFFPDTIYLTIPHTSSQQNPHDLGTIVIKEKLHRALVSVVSKNNNQGVLRPVEGATVIIGNQNPVNTSNFGMAGFVFASPSNEFRIRINKAGLNHVPVDEYITIPISKNNIVYTYELDMGRTISGKVRDTDTGEAIAGAKIFAEIGMNEYGPIFVETVSNSSGDYTLSGVPRTQIRLSANKPGNNIHPGYQGVSITIGNNINTQDFSLKAIPFFINDIWGFEVEIMTINNSVHIENQYRVSGFLKIYNNTQYRGFRLDDGQKKLRFTNLLVQVDDNNKARPVANQFALAEEKIRIRLSDDFLVSASKSHGYNIEVYALGGGDEMEGYLRAPIETSLEYFNFSYNYNGKFNLFDSGMEKLTFMKSSNQADFTWRYNVGKLMSIMGQTIKTNTQFSIFEFPATASWQNSYVEGKTFYLNSSLKVTIPMMNTPLQINVGNIEVSPTNITIKDRGESISFKLEKWDIVTGPWNYDKNYGGLRVNKARIATNLLTVENVDLTIKPDRLIMNSAATINTSNLTLGGVANLQAVNGAVLTAHMTFVESSPHDQRPHWRLGLVNVNDPFGNAFFINLNPLQNQRLYFKRVISYSDDHSTNSLADYQTVNYWNHFNQQVSNVFVGTDFFRVNGMVSLNVPGAQERTGTFMWTKPQNSGPQVQVYAYSTTIKMEGNVEFVTDQIPTRVELNPDKFSLRGHITISNNHSQNEIVLTSRFYKEMSKASLKIVRGISDAISNWREAEFDLMSPMQTIGNTSQGHQRVESGITNVKNGKWEFLEYTAVLTNFENLDPKAEKVLLEISGSIKKSIKDNTEIHTSNIDVGLGSFTMDFNFNTFVFTGILTISTPVPLGAAVINNGSVMLELGPKGFFLAASVLATYPVIMDLTTNFIVGHHSDISQQTLNMLTNNMYNKSLPGRLKNGEITGFYLAANKSFIDFELDFEIGIIYCRSGLDIKFIADFAPDYFQIRLEGYFMAEAGLNVFLGVCEVGFSGGVEAQAAGEVLRQNGQTAFTLCICGAIFINIDACMFSFDGSAMARGILTTGNGGSFSPYFSLSDTCQSNGCN